MRPLLALIVGVSLGWATRQLPRSAPSEAPSVSVATSTPDCPPAEAGASAGTAAAEVVRIASELERIASIQRSLEGVRSEWTDDVPAAFRPEALAPLLEDVADEVEHELVFVGVDCDEYPCVGVYQLAHDTSDPRSTNGKYASAVVEVLKQRLEGQGARFTSPTWRGGPNDEHRFAIGVFAGRPTGDVKFRFDQRIADHMADR